jgi:thiol-disulfide isomerase/thioredoxin
MAAFFFFSTLVRFAGACAPCIPPILPLQHNSIQENIMTEKNSLTKASAAAKLPDIGPAPELQGLSDWINSAPLTLESLRGKVVLIDFWTYSCVNCLRTLPHVSGWYEKYKDQGLVIIGIHAPEFSFEHQSNNVRDAIERYHIKYPVALDNSYSTWEAFQNQYWPAHYFIDKQGHIRHEHFGEGQYDESESVIQQLLAEGSPAKIELPSPSKAAAGGAADFGVSSAAGQTPETYLGTLRRERFAVGNSSALPALHYGVITEGFKSDRESIESTSDHDALTFNIKAKKVFLVAESAKPAELSVQTVDNKNSVLSEHKILINESRLYEILDLPKFQETTIRLVPLSAGMKMYAFTFSAGSAN